MPSGSNLLFVYGTLKRGDVRAHLLNGQEYLGLAVTIAIYRLYDVGEYPALAEAKPLGLAGRSIQGELWAVDDACLSRLDEEEGVDEGLYERSEIELSDGQRVLSYLYLRSTDGMADCGDRWGSE